MDENENVFRTDNISELWKYGQENLQEILSKQLYQRSTSALWLSPFSGLVVTLYANQRDAARRFFGEQMALLVEVELTGTHILVVLAVVREGVATEKTFLLVLGRPRVYMLEQGNMLLGRGCRGSSGPAG